MTCVVCFRCHCIHINFYVKRKRPSNDVRETHKYTYIHTHRARRSHKHIFIFTKQRMWAKKCAFKCGRHTKLSPVLTDILGIPQRSCILVCRTSEPPDQLCHKLVVCRTTIEARAYTHQSPVELNRNVL